MSLRNALNGAEINCIASCMFANISVQWLAGLVRDKLSRLNRTQQRLFGIVVNTDSNDKPVTYWFAFYASV